MFWKQKREIEKDSDGKNKKPGQAKFFKMPFFSDEGKFFLRSWLDPREVQDAEGNYDSAHVLNSRCPGESQEERKIQQGSGLEIFQIVYEEI